MGDAAVVTLTVTGHCAGLIKRANPVHHQRQMGSDENAHDSDIIITKNI